MFSFFNPNSDHEATRKGKTWILILTAAIGIALIFFGGTSKHAETSDTETDYRTDNDELIIYQTYLESRVKTLCESVNGVGNVSVVVTLAGSFESVYATELQEGKEEYVILGNGSSASALYLTRSAPEIAGIGIVCKGGGNTSVRCELIALLSASFHVSSNRIYVTEAR